ncbi:MAG: putative Cytochrome [Verrucomicrobiales bacterium]|nr:putative Cytochrome [Verrucomicrobiales bacterium]
MDLHSRSVKDLPGPKGLPLLGNLHEVDLKKLHRILEDWVNMYGPLYKFRLGTHPVVVVADTENVQQILRQRPNIYRRLGAIETVFLEMGITGVFSAEGNDWKRQRRLTAHALDAIHLREFFPILLRVTERLRKRWMMHADSGATVDIQQDLMRYTVDVTTNLAFGYDMNTLEKEGDVIQDHLQKIFPMINRRINSPFPYWRYLKLPADHALDAALKAIQQAIASFVSQGRVRLAANPDLLTHPTNLLEVMLSARDENGGVFSDVDIHGNVMTLLLAGEDTTANTLAWTANYMVNQPEIQTGVQTEVSSLVSPTGMLHSIQNADKMEYSEAVANETLRLKPVAPILFLEPMQDVTLSGVTVEKGTSIFLLTMHGGLQDSNFQEASQFNPGRWLQPTTTSGCPFNHTPKAFLPFGGGPRFCPGRQLAMVEMKMVMAMLCSQFEIVKVDGPKPVTELFSFTMMPQNLLVRFKARNRTGA